MAEAETQLRQDERSAPGRGHPCGPIAKPKSLDPKKDDADIGHADDDDAADTDARRRAARRAPGRAQGLPTRRMSARGGGDRG